MRYEGQGELEFLGVLDPIIISGINISSHE